MANKKETALTERQSGGFLQLADVNMAAMMAEELDGLDTSFERIKIPSAGSTVFEIPGENPGEPDTVKEFSGVILYHHTLHAYYKTKYSGGNNPPDCGSFDGITGEGDPGGSCKTCPYNKFGSGENNSKACKNRRRIFVLREGEIFPLLLSLPTGSLKEFTKYIKRLLGKGRKSNSVVTRFSLRKATNSGGIAYSQRSLPSTASLRRRSTHCSTSCPSRSKPTADNWRSTSTTRWIRKMERTSPKLIRPPARLSNR
jgi:hypothetical protein